MKEPSRLFFEGRRCEGVELCLFAGVMIVRFQVIGWGEMIGEPGRPVPMI